MRSHFRRRPPLVAPFWRHSQDLFDHLGDEGDAEGSWQWLNALVRLTAVQQDWKLIGPRQYLMVMKLMVLLLLMSTLTLKVKYVSSVLLLSSGPPQLSTDPLQCLKKTHRHHYFVDEMVVVLFEKAAGT
jgi:hypothetical protein